MTNNVIAAAREGFTLRPAVRSLLLTGILASLIALVTAREAAAATEYRRCAVNSTCTIGEFLYDDSYTPIPPANASCELSITDPSGTPLSGSPFATNEAGDGWYSYNFDTTGQAEGLYRSTLCCNVPATNEDLCLDKSFIVGASYLSPNDVAGAVWDANLTDHTTAGTFGWYLQNPLGLVKDIWEYSARSLTVFGDLAADVWNSIYAPIRSLTTREITPTEHIAQEETLEKRWTTRFAGDGEVMVGKTYRVKLWVYNYETELTDAVTNPTITIKDSDLTTRVSSATMNKTGTGYYEYAYFVPATGVPSGRWETVVTVNVGGAAPINDGSYWEVESDSPAQVKLNAITDNTIPSITASATIKNEGGTGYEYKYAYCVVNNPNNQCGGGDDTFYAQDAKWLDPGETWNTPLNATVPDAGTYWFKLVVYWGTERSVAVRQFNAVAEGAACLGDYNLDGWVDLTDFSILLYYWNKNDAAHDLSGDGKVNLTDFSIMLFHWGKCP